MRKGLGAAGIFLLFAPILFSQTSTNYQLTEYTFNNGGNPSPVLSSVSYRMTLDAIGDGLSSQGLASASYGMDGGFANTYPPPSEVHNLRWPSKTTLAWTPEISVGTYDLYWGPLTDLPLGDYGDFNQCRLASTLATDTSGAPPPGGFFFLVTANNRINEEGTMGRKSDGGPRPNPGLCP